MREELLDAYPDPAVWRSERVVFLEKVSGGRGAPYGRVVKRINGRRREYTGDLSRMLGLFNTIVAEWKATKGVAWKATSRDD